MPLVRYDRVDAHCLVFSPRHRNHLRARFARSLVARGADCDFPEAVRSTPLLAEGDTKVLAALQLDCVIAAQSIPAATLAGLDAAIENVGALIGARDAAARLTAELRARLDAVRQSVGSAAHRPTVAVLTGVSPLFGGEAWIMEQVDCAGGRPMIGDEGQPARTHSWDDVVWVQPEMVILAARGCDVAEGIRQFDTLSDHAVWRDLPATYLNQIYVADGGLFAQPGPGAVTGAEVLAGLLHPDVWAFPSAAQAARASQLLRINLREA